MKYHLRRQDKALENEAAIDEILLTQRFVTVAMCSGGEPYLVTLTHGYDPAQSCIFFHCAGEGKKIDILKTNPKVWGVAVEDLGYLDGKCDHAYRSVMFSGRVTFLKTGDDKRKALEVMIRRQESDPESVLERLISPGRLDEVCIGRIDIEQVCGKQSLP